MTRSEVLDRAGPGLIVGGVVSALVLVGYLVASSIPPAQKPMYRVGETVTIRQSGERAPVLEVWCRSGVAGQTESPPCTYILRVRGNTLYTNTHTLSPDGAITGEPYSLVRFHEFELTQ